MTIRIDLKVFLFAILFFLTKQIEIYIIIMTFALIHEIGHLLAGLCLKMKPERIELMPFGFSISFKIETKEFNRKIKFGNYLQLKKIVIAATGPIVNIICVLILSFIDININLKVLMIYSNILIATFNMLPIYPLDGGRILKGILHINLGMKKSKIYINEIAFLTMIIITAISSIAVYYFENISIFLIIMYLWIVVLKENKKYKINMKLYELIEQKI